MADRQAPNRAQLRKILQAFSPSGFEAFLLDYLPEVYRRLSTGMDKTKQVNLCFELCENAEVWAALREAAPLMDEAARCLTRQFDFSVHRPMAWVAGRTGERSKPAEVNEWEEAERAKSRG